MREHVQPLGQEGNDDRRPGLQLIAAGRNPADHQVALMQMVCVADSTEKAWEAAGEGLEYFVNFYELRKDLHGVLPPPDRRVTVDMLRSGNAGFWSAAVGTPDEVLAALQPLASGAMGRITQFALQFRHAGMTTADTHRSMRLFAEHVMPAL